MKLSLLLLGIVLSSQCVSCTTDAAGNRQFLKRDYHQWVGVLFNKPQDGDAETMK